MSVSARILNWQVHRAYAGPNYGPPQTVKIYSNPGHGLTTVDGDASRQGTNLPWADLHDGAGTGRQYVDTAVYIWLSAGNLSNRWVLIRRHKATFNLADIPAGALIDAVSYYWYCTSVVNQLPQASAYALYIPPTPPWNDVVLADYQGYTSAPISNVLPYSAIAVGAFNHHDITAVYLPLFVPGQLAKIGMREANFDAPNTPPTWQSGRASYISFWTVDYATAALRPYLEVTYRPLL